MVKPLIDHVSDALLRSLQPIDVTFPPNVMVTPSSCASLSSEIASKFPVR